MEASRLRDGSGSSTTSQAASVVVICEPQVKPTVEHQAVARAHRMGQVRPVRVYRLLAIGGVDERLVRILEAKTRLFDAYARRSAVAEEEQARLGTACERLAAAD